jgi:malate dehydrogenase (oxaloacetate-decarboxylating)
MSAAPSVSYSITLRLEVPAGAKTVSQLTSAVESAGGTTNPGIKIRCRPPPVR